MSNGHANKGHTLGSRLLLRDLRAVMRDAAPGQAKIDRIVSLIAANMVAEVCSLYLMRSDGELELFATEGLRRAAIHQTRLRMGEGVIGDIAENATPISLPDARTSPKFAYRPETGEDEFRSMMGAPVLRGGRVVGVIAVQNRAPRIYSEEEVETLETVAMVIAELANAGELLDPAEHGEIALPGRGPRMFMGQGLAEGLARGVAALHDPRVSVREIIAHDVVAERHRLTEALGAMRASIDEMIDADDLGVGEHREVLESYRMFANDRGWARRLREAVDGGLTAEAAVERVQEENAAQMARVRDPYMRERLQDLDDLSNRLLRRLSGVELKPDDLPEEAVIIARGMGPAELLDYDRRRLKALVIEEGTATSHVAIVARALQIPLVGGVSGVNASARAGDVVIVDGDSGDVHLRPTAEVEQAYTARVAQTAERRARFAALRGLPSITRDGIAVDLSINAGLPIDLAHLNETGAEGIGLFRTELPFMLGAAMPRRERQRALYADILAAAGDRPVVFRTLDIGSDKTLSYLRQEREENPALGLRSIRLALARPGLLTLQAQALLQAAAGETLRVMFPMVTTVSEFEAARALFEGERARLSRRGGEGPKRVLYGAMIETPAVAYAPEDLIAQADFLSIGTNDLMQFFFAADRNHPRVSRRYDVMDARALRLIAGVARACADGRTPLSICGEAAGYPVEAAAFVALGVRALSMAPNCFGRVKLALRGLNAAAAADVLDTLMRRPNSDIRAEFKRRLCDQGLQLS